MEDNNIHLTKKKLLVMLKKAYLRGLWEHSEQKFKTRIDVNQPRRMLNIPDNFVEDLIEE